MSKWKSIQKSIHKGVNNSTQEYTTKRINKYIMEINLSRNIKKLIIFEPEECYTDIDFAINFFTEVKKIKADLPSENSLVISYFSGVDGLRLGTFITGQNISIDDQLNIPIDFNLLPANYNTQGIASFTFHLGEIANQPKIENDINSFENYIDYFVSKIEEVGGRINLVIPTAFMSLHEHSSTLADFFEKIKDILRKSRELIN
jgi:hypothetical protein